MRIRTINGTAQSADYDTHSGGPFSAGTYRWIDIERWGDRPVAYVASGSHGVWPDAGKHVYAQLLNLWQLVDVTDDYGPIWDTKGHVVPIEYWTGPNRAKKLWHTGKDAWLNFVGFWGNLGSDTCWWHSFVGICQLMTGPPGPNRKFGGPPDCLLGVAQDDWSKYSFYLSANATLQAPWHNITTVVVEQVCARPGMAFKSSYDDPWTDPALKPEDLEIWTIPHPIPYAGRAEHSVTLPACGGQRSAAKAYRLAMYDGLGEWVTTSPIRNVCTYVPDQAGWIMSSGADVMDWDEWRWEFRPVVPNVTLADGTRGQPKRTPPPVQWPLPRPIRF